MDYGVSCGRRIASILLALVAVVALAACGTRERAAVGERGASGPSDATTRVEEVEAYSSQVPTNPAWRVYQADDPVAAAMERESYTHKTLEDQAGESSSVIRGRIASVELGRAFGPAGFEVVYATMNVVADEVLRGDAPVKVDGRVRVEFPLPGAVDPSGASAEAIIKELDGLTSGEPTIFFLRHKAQEAVDIGLSERVDEERGWYRIVSATGLITSNYGWADVTMYLPHHHNPPIVREIEQYSMNEFEDVVTKNS
jgi:hypothetical protein